MKIDKQENYVILENELNNLNDFVSLLKLQIPNNFKSQNIVINLLTMKSIYLEDILMFLEISNKHRESKKSFVIVNNALNPDDIPSEMVVVPTLHEAEDIIGMEEMERELGF